MNRSLTPVPSGGGGHPPYTVSRIQTEVGENSSGITGTVRNKNTRFRVTRRPIPPSFRVPDVLGDKGSGYTSIVNKVTIYRVLVFPVKEYNLRKPVKYR